MKVLIGAIVLMTSWTLTAHAQYARGYIYERTFISMGESYVRLLSKKGTDSLSELSADKRNMCQQRYRGILDDGVLDIRIAIGYFDWTIGRSVSYAGRNYGLSPSLDIGAYTAISSLLTSSCYGQQRFCGFRQESGNPYVFTRNTQIHGRNIQARIEMHFASATETLDDNLKYRRNEQQQRTQFSESFFAKALKDSDAVFYFGHSRNGGGPDFAPPVFVPGTNKVNYNGYYLKDRPGLKRMTSALSSSAKKAPIIGLMSCASRPHFLQRLRAVAPNTGVITSTSVLQVDEVYTAMIGAVDALMRGQCQQSFYQSLRMTAKNQQFITMDGMFE